MALKFQQLWDVVATIPKGAVASYGDVGRELDPPVSGLITGRWMASLPEEYPWWRVAASSGVLVIGKRDPALAMLQRQRLESEGVEFVGDRVDMARFRHYF